MPILIFNGDILYLLGRQGNVIFFASAFADHNIAGMLNRATTFIAFTLGLLLVGLFHKYVKSNYWRVFCLFPILFICLGVGFVPKNVPNYYVVPVIAFGLAVQNASLLLQKIFVLKTIWFAVLLLGTINIVYTISLNKRKKLSFSKNE